MPIDVDEFLRMSPVERRAYVGAGNDPPEGWGDSGAATEFLLDGVLDEPQPDGA